jgi:hypothetical protein
MARVVARAYLQSMAWYEFKTYKRRQTGAPAVLIHARRYEARTDEAAMFEAYERVHQLAPGHFGSLYGPDGAQVWVQDSPEA